MEGIDVADDVRFSVDPSTNSRDPARRRAYGLTIHAPWENGGFLFVNFPEHLEYMPGTKGIARHHDDRDNVWHVSDEGKTASYDVESLTDPGMRMAVEGKADAGRASFEMTLTNRTGELRGSIRPMLCHQYGALAGFPDSRTDNFARTFVVIGGELVALDNLEVLSSEAYARMAQAKGCPDHHNWWAERMGGLIEEEIDFAFTAVQGDDDRKLIVFWTPGKCLLSNRAIPCIHSDPYYGNLANGDSRTAKGMVIFTREPLQGVVNELTDLANRPWETA